MTAHTQARPNVAHLPPQALLHARARGIMQRHAKSFSWAARLLSKSARTDAAVLYAFARTADDWADEESLGSPQERLGALLALRAQVLGNPGSLKEPTVNKNIVAGPNQAAFDSELGEATALLLYRLQIDVQVVSHFFDALESDTGPRIVGSLAHENQYAFGVAGTVGVMMCPLLGAQPQAACHAAALGVAMQLTNMARDVVEDAHRGRIYLSGLAHLSPTALIEPHPDTADLVYAEVSRTLLRAEAIYQFAGRGIALIAPENRRAILAALRLYRAIGRKILSAGQGRYWEGRAHLGPWARARVLGGAAVGRLGGAAGRVPVFAERNAVDAVWRDIVHLPGCPQLMWA